MIMSTDTVRQWSFGLVLLPYYTHVHSYEYL